MIPHLCPFELEIKMADEDEVFRKCRRIAPELIADFEKPCFSLELEIFKSTTSDGEPAPAVETPSTSEHFPHNITLMEFVKNLQSFLQSYNKSLINQTCPGPYWENIGPRSFLYGPRCARSVLSRPRADILPVRLSRLVNKTYVIIFVI